MEQIKLEVGRRYLVRDPVRAKHKGREQVVRIVRKENFDCPFRGDDDVLYYANGRLYYGIESPYDLVREVTP